MNTHPPPTHTSPAVAASNPPAVLTNQQPQLLSCRPRPSASRAAALAALALRLPATATSLKQTTTQTRGCHRMDGFMHAGVCGRTCYCVRPTGWNTLTESFAVRVGYFEHGSPTWLQIPRPAPSTPVLLPPFPSLPSTPLPSPSLLHHPSPPLPSAAPSPPHTSLQSTPDSDCCATAPHSVSPQNVSGLDRPQRCPIRARGGAMLPRMRGQLLESRVPGPVQGAVRHAHVHIQEHAQLRAGRECRGPLVHRQQHEAGHGQHQLSDAHAGLQQQLEADDQASVIRPLHGGCRRAGRR